MQSACWTVCPTGRLGYQAADPGHLGTPPPETCSERRLIDAHFPSPLLRQLCMLAAQRAPILPIPILKDRCCRQVSVSRMDLVAVGGTRVNAVHSRDRSLTQGKLRRVGSHILRDPEQAANAKSGLRERNRLT